MSGWYVYEDFVTHEAVVHRSDCVHCNYGQGHGAGRDERENTWHGEFSSAVPELDAKPVIDILAGISDLESARTCIGLVAPLGYLYAPSRAAEMYWFCKPHPSRRTHHLHLVPVTSARCRDELRFRDYLRSHRQARAEYARLKHSLAERFGWDRDAYTQAKTAFVSGILRRAGDAG
jgi:GrpB-like predicted nucleotidyltransferase (UPF0157 family)